MIRYLNLWEKIYIQVWSSLTVPGSQLLNPSNCLSGKSHGRRFSPWPSVPEALQDTGLRVSSRREGWWLGEPGLRYEGGNSQSPVGFQGRERSWRLNQWPMISHGAKPPLKTQTGRLLSCFREPSGGECPSPGRCARPHARKDIAPWSKSLPVCLHLATDLYPFINMINQQSREQMVFLGSLSPPRKLSKMRRGSGTLRFIVSWSAGQVTTWTL